MLEHLVMRSAVHAEPFIVDGVFMASFDPPVVPNWIGSTAEHVGEQFGQYGRVHKVARDNGPAKGFIQFDSPDGFIVRIAEAAGVTSLGSGGPA